MASESDYREYIIALTCRHCGRKTEIKATADNEDNARELAIGIAWGMDWDISPFAGIEKVFCPICAPKVDRPVPYG